MSNVHTLLRITDTLALQFASDGLGRFFLILVSIMWVLACIYTMKYKEHQDHNGRFFVFFWLTWAMLAALTMAANYFTMYLCFEFMTLLSMPLVLHNGTPEAIAAAKKYLFYSIFGATMGLMGMFLTGIYGTSLSFAPGGVLDPSKVAGHESLLLWGAFLSIVGFGAKAGMFPLHAWLPTAHPVAPAPASALLSGCITKAGVLCIIRLLYQVFGLDFLKGTWVQTALICLALITVFMGSMMAFGEDVMKKRFAYSTVSQVSYVLLGVFLMNETAMLGALLHAAYHSIIKNGLFLCAGSIIFWTHREKVSEMKGLGRSMPVTFGCLTIFSLGLVGIPPFAGFLSKWYLAAGSLSSGLGALSWLAPAVLLLSALLTAGYLFPIAIHGFFPAKGEDTVSGEEGSALMLGPIAVLAALVILTGVFASPLADALAAVAATLF